MVMKRFIYWLLTMLGFSSMAGCDVPVMYGTPSADYEIKGKVLDCVQPGYMLNEKVIRHAKVAVGE